MMIKKRIHWLDFGKGFTMFLVVMYHSMLFSSINTFPKFTDFLSIFIMPVFFSISGYLYKDVISYKDYLLLVYKKVTSLLIPYFLFTVLLFILYKNHIESTVLGTPHFTMYTLLVCSGPSYLWYIYILFIIFLVIGLINLLLANRNIFSIITSIILLLCAIFLAHPFGMKQFVFWVICFCIGYCFKCLKISAYFYKLSIKSKYTFIFILILIFILFVFMDNYFSGIRMNGIDDAFSKYNIFAKFFSIILFLSIFICLKRSNGFFKYFSKYGKYTYVIYLVHLPIIFILIKIVGKLLPLTNFVSIVITIITWILCIIICKASVKYKIFNIIFYPRKYISHYVLRTHLGKWLFN